jgi:hypothetical protein
MAATVDSEDDNFVASGPGRSRDLCHARSTHRINEPHSDLRLRLPSGLSRVVAESVTIAIWWEGPATRIRTVSRSVLREKSTPAVPAPCLAATITTAREGVPASKRWEESVCSSVTVTPIVVPATPARPKTVRAVVARSTSASIETRARPFFLVQPSSHRRRSSRMRAKLGAT